MKKGKKCHGISDGKLPGAQDLIKKNPDMVTGKKPGNTAAPVAKKATQVVGNDPEAANRDVPSGKTRAVRAYAAANSPRRSLPEKLPGKLPGASTAPKPEPNIIKHGAGAMYGTRSHAMGTSHCIAEVRSGMVGYSKA